ncbi:hypothetical protein COX23_05370, partial [Candidatus Gottesmanbacteria bacterium CG23_combo_of_CG06-09_8_20_14_all_37_19]
MKKIQNQIINSQIRIVEFNPRYIEGIKHVVFSAMKDLRPNYNPLTDPRNEDLDKIPQIYGGKGKFWVALNKQQVIGTIAVLEDSVKSADLKRFFLLKEYRGRKIGWKLLQVALDHCNKQGFKEIYLITSTYAADAQRLFQRNGFIRTRRTFEFD